MARDLETKPRSNTIEKLLVGGKDKKDKTNSKNAIPDLESLEYNDAKSVVKNEASAIRETLEIFFDSPLMMLRTGYFVGRKEDTRNKHIRFSRKKEEVLSKIEAMRSMWCDIKQVSYHSIDMQDEKLYVGVIHR